MADFLKNNPMALRHCILFEVLQGTSIEKTYSNICSVILKNDPIALRQCIRYDSLRRNPSKKFRSNNHSMVGNEVIDYNNFNLSFNEFSTGKSNEKEGEKPIAEILRNDKYALRVCILYESLKYHRAYLHGHIFYIFVNFCEDIGVEKVLKFSEFEFWFYRFLNEDYDMNYERDEEKKIYELSDMPVNVMENIVEYLDILDRIKLARTSRSLQTFVDDQKLFNHTLKMTVSTRRINVSFGKSVKIQYIWDYDGCERIFKNRETNVQDVLYWKQAFLDLKQFLKNPKLHLDTLAIDLTADDEKYLFDDLEDAFKFTHHLNVENLILDERSSDLLTRILPALKPGYLTTIDIYSTKSNEDSMNTVSEMEQWTQAKQLRMKGFFMCSLHHLFHFKEFTVTLVRLSVENIRQIKEVLFKSPDFEKCSIMVYDRKNAKNAIEEEFGPDNPEYIKVYPILNSTDYFEIKNEGSNFKITRKKK